MQGKQKKQEKAKYLRPLALCRGTWETYTDKEIACQGG